jgi:hypothetical protein
MKNWLKIDYINIWLFTNRISIVNDVTLLLGFWIQTFFYVFFNVESEYATDFALSIIVFAQDYGKIIISDPVY